MGKARLIKKGIDEAVEFFGSLFEDVPVVRGEVPDSGLLPVRNSGITVSPNQFDEAAYDLKYPRPEGKWNDPLVKQWTRKKQHAKHTLSNRDGYDAIGDKIVSESQAGWDAANPPPFPDVNVKNMTNEQLADHKAHMDRRRWENLTPLQQEGERVLRRQRQNERYANLSPEEKQAKLEYHRKYSQDNKEELREKTLERMQDPERIQRRREYERQRLANMSDEELERHRDLISKAQKARRNKAEEDGTIHLIRAEEAYRAAMRRKGIEQATPSNADPDLIKEFYQIAGEIGQITGIPHHVHHTVPLSGRMPGSRKRSASGLHSQDNLMVIPGSQNVRESNKFLPGDVPEGTGIEAARSLLEEVLKSQGR